ncbi:unnamed protein product [Zymoseptoria tritici ST99CH_1A5]|uniref:CBM1 domain-containing protein n=2 Tax=Zymoseptoria tritici TaxID=1047171 RepID=A0A2H1GJ51_ZYMTR|nr:unnamed protein product [Zymoseptoria tritici ST99CH_1E4]SMY25114.1 unnamed protein product [Zymoseptoria tritici ST99CH_1A5]
MRSQLPAAATALLLLTTLLIPLATADEFDCKGMQICACCYPPGDNQPKNGYCHTNSGVPYCQEPSNGKDPRGCAGCL